MSAITQTATSEFQFGTGDGLTVKFPLVPDASGFRGTPSIYRKDWRGDQLLSTAARSNLLTRSAEFDNAAWVKSALTIATNAATAPDGNGAALKLIADTTTAVHQMYESQNGLTGTVTFSIHARAGEYKYLCLSATGSPYNYAYFDLSVGTVALSDSTVNGAIEALADGWYRCSITYNKSGASIGYPLAYPYGGALPAAATIGPRFTGDGVSGLYAWGAQLETAGAPSPYIATTATSVTVTDYSIDDAAEVTFAQPPLRGAILSWLGSFSYTRVVTPPSFARSTVISQYANSPIICQLIENMGQYIDPAADIDAFYDTVWNVDTATGFGLDFWGKVVNVSRLLNIPGSVTDFGFSEGNGNNDYAPFGQAPLYLTAPKSTVYALADNAYRVLILAKALANISDGTAPSINRLLQNMFKGRGRCYVADLGLMQLQYVFEFYLQPYEVAIITQSGALPRPAGVSAKLLQVDVPNTFGFSEMPLIQPFGQGTLFNPSTGLLNATV